MNESLSPKTNFCELVMVHYDFLFIQSMWSTDDKTIFFSKGEGSDSVFGRSVFPVDTQEDELIVFVFIFAHSLENGFGIFCDGKFSVVSFVWLEINDGKVFL